MVRGPGRTPAAGSARPYRRRLRRVWAARRRILEADGVEMGCAFCVGSKREVSRRFTRHDTTWHHTRQKHTPNRNSKADQHLALATAVAPWRMRHPNLVESCFAPSNPPSSPPLSSLYRLSGPKDGLGCTGDIPRDDPHPRLFSVEYPDSIWSAVISTRVQICI
jgi:hypothetical protein